VEEGFQLREVINAGTVKKISQDVSNKWPEFDHISFCKEIIHKLAE